MKVTILGCGGSGGVPMIGNYWGACDPSNPKNRRRRVSILVETDEGKYILIDCGPDVREQLNAANVCHLDAVLVTHYHADHVFGIDDLRRLYWVNERRSTPMYASAETFNDIERYFPYVFQPWRVGEGLPLTQNLIKSGESFTVEGVEIIPFTQEHGRHKSLGFRIGGLAYSTDVNHLDEKAFTILKGVKLWVVDCLRRTPHAAHSHLEQTLEWIARVKPAQAVLTHMDHSLDYADALAACPPGVVPAYDGLELAL